MRNTLILFAVLVLALGLYFMFVHNQQGSSNNPREMAFAVDDTAAIHRIVIENIKQKQVESKMVLEREKGGWRLNEQYSAFVPRVNQFMDMIHQIEVRASLQEQGQESGIELLRQGHKKVSFYGKMGTKIQSYYVGTSTPDRKGTLMMIEGEDTPYIVELPGMQGYLNHRYNTNWVEWRENLLFRANPEKLKSVEIRYTEDAERDVKLRHESAEAEWELAGIEFEPDTSKINAYFEPFEGKVYAESFASLRYPDAHEALKAETPDMRFVATYFDGSKREIVLFEREDNRNNFFGWVEGENELLTIQLFVFEKFLAERSDFLPEAL